MLSLGLYSLTLVVIFKVTDQNTLFQLQLFQINELSVADPEVIQVTDPEVFQLIFFRIDVS